MSGEAWRRRSLRAPSLRHLDRLAGLQAYVDAFDPSLTTRAHFWQGFRFLVGDLEAAAFADTAPSRLREHYYDLLSQAETDAGEQPGRLP